MKKYTIYGNCQADAVARILNTNKRFSKEYEYVPIKAVFLLSTDDINNLNTNVFPNIDLFICQPITNFDEKYTTEYILNKIIKKDAVKIMFPSLYASVYHPQIVYINNCITKNKLKASTEYHDINLLNEFNSNSNFQIDTLLKKYNSSDRCDILQQDIARLQEREINDPSVYFISVTDFIKTNCYHALLFYTINHPTKILFQYICKQILTFLNIKDTEINLNLDPLEDVVQFPIYNSFQNINEKHYCVIDKKKINIFDIFNKDFAIYEEICKLDDSYTYVIFTNTTKYIFKTKSLFYNPTENVLTEKTIIIVHCNGFDIDLIMKFLSYVLKYDTFKCIQYVGLFSCVYIKTNTNILYGIFNKYYFINHDHEAKLNLALICKNNTDTFNNQFASDKQICMPVWINLHNNLWNTDLKKMSPETIVDLIELSLFNFTYSEFRYGMLSVDPKKYYDNPLETIKQHIFYIISNDKFHFKISNIIFHILDKYCCQSGSISFNNIFLSKYNLNAKNVTEIVDYIEQSIFNKFNTPCRYGLINNILSTNLVEQLKYIFKEFFACQ